MASGWSRDLKVGEFYFQCPECERTWIANDTISPCPDCGTKTCQKCWGVCPEHGTTHRCPGDRHVTDQVRCCPRCRVSFVKEEQGCNHVVCPRCHAHICYRCNKMFHGDEIYREHFGVDCPLSPDHFLNDASEFEEDVLLECQT
jgi:hypothetical protein